MRLTPDHLPSALPLTLPLPVAASGASFASFWMGGFEGADHVNLAGVPLDMVRITGHAQQFATDYALARSVGIRTLCESVGWRVCAPEQARHMDFSRMHRAADAAAQNGVQLLWSLMHYGTPPDVCVSNPDFAERFADFAAAAARQLRGRGEGASIYNPINEIGFLAWALATQSVFGARCDERDGYIVKLALVRAALRGMQAIRAEDPGARFVHIEPLIHVVAPVDRPELAQAAEDFCAYQWQVWDLLMGRREPQLGGAPELVDWIGVNHYYDAQWEIGSDLKLDWEKADVRRVPFGQMLQQAWARYGVPLIVAETSHVGRGRAAWLHEMAAQTQQAMVRGVPVHGLCLYPLVDRPDWNQLQHWHQCGLWDAIDPHAPFPQAEPAARFVATEYAHALAYWQTRLPPCT